MQIKDLVCFRDVIWGFFYETINQTLGCFQILNFLSLRLATTFSSVLS